MPKAAVVGVGLIGRAWANVFARAGWDVALWDADGAALSKAPDQIARALHDLARHGLVDDADAAARRLRVATSLGDAVGDVDLVQENGPERVEVKIEIYKDDEAAAKQEQAA